jgi:hypothetical protein
MQVVVTEDTLEARELLVVWQVVLTQERAVQVEGIYPGRHHLMHHPVVQV